MKKFFCFFVAFLLVLCCLRLLFVNSSPVSMRGALQVIDEEGQVFDVNKLYYDIQVLHMYFDNITEFLYADYGDQYYITDIAPLPHPNDPIPPSVGTDFETIYDTEGNSIAYTYKLPNTKPNWDDVGSVSSFFTVLGQSINNYFQMFLQLITAGWTIVLDTVQVLLSFLGACVKLLLRFVFSRTPL